MNTSKKPFFKRVYTFVQLILIAFAVASAIKAQTSGVDLSFNAIPEKNSTSISNFALQPDDKIIVFGNFQVVNGAIKSQIASLNVSPYRMITPYDYDGDGRANIAVFRLSNGTWFTSTTPQSNYNAVQFGANGDVPVPGDYDGDGRADVAVFRPSNGVWYLNRSTQGSTGVSFGSAEDNPIPNAFVR